MDGPKNATVPYGCIKRWPRKVWTTMDIILQQILLRFLRAIKLSGVDVLTRWQVQIVSSIDHQMSRQDAM